MSILETINGHDDLVALTASQRGILCQEIREFLVSSVSRTGGHLASNLGAVELTVALETVFDTRKDRLVFDVGHQSYVHKLLTGRREMFSNLRQFGGMAGFPKPSESITDAFVAGHASSSVSIALGMARARSLQKDDYHVIALIGDGAATGGMAYEAMNDAGDSGVPLIVILNDNEMSIDRNVGGFAAHLSRLRSGKKYLGAKEWYKSAVMKLPGGKAIYKFSADVKEWIKRSLLRTTIFENMGLDYLGPVDGSDTEQLIEILQTARDMKCPVLIHVLTRKGSGYLHAEKKPSKFHGIGAFDPETGAVAATKKESFSDAFGDEMIRLAQKESRICAITAAMPGGTGLLRFKEQYPDRLFDVGIAEEHAVSMAGGLAKQGMIPVAAIYSTFLQRSFDQIMQDTAMLNQHVVFAVDRAGLVGEDGETHHGIYDIGFLRQVPNMKILCPASCAELRQMLDWAVLEHNGPVAVRYPRGGDRSYADAQWDPSCPVVRHRQGKDVTLLTYGVLLEQTMEAAQLLHQIGIEATVLRLTEIAEIDGALIRSAMPETGVVVCLEETCAGSGIKEMLAWELRKADSDCRVYGMDLGRRFVTHGSIKELYHHFGLDGEGIAAFVREVL
jgi:1-deoxy-D-xylulose-5-phosphate synthase